MHLHQCKFVNGTGRSSTEVYTDIKDDIVILEGEAEYVMDGKTTVRIPTIHSVEKVESFIKCMKCSRQVLQPMATAVIHCDRCGCLMRSGDCEK